MQVPVLGGHREVALLPEPQEELYRLLVELAGVGGVSVLLKIGVDLVEDSAVLRGGLLLRSPVGVGDVLVDARDSGVVALCHGCHSLQFEVVKGLRFHPADSGLECEEPGSLAVIEHLKREVSQEDAQCADICGPVGSGEEVGCVVWMRGSRLGMICATLIGNYGNLIHYCQYCQLHIKSFGNVANDGYNGESRGVQV